MRPSTTMQSLGQLQPSFVAMGKMGGFDAVAIQSHPEIERINLRASRRQFSGIVDGAGAVLARQQGSRHKTRPEAACQNPRLHQYRLRAGDDADRSGRCDPEACSSVRA